MGQLKGDIEAGRLVPIVQMGSKKHPIFGDAPLVHDLARNDEERRLARFVYGLAELSRPIAVPPGVPAERVEALREAFQQMVRSPEVAADAAKLRIIVDPMNAAETAEVFREVLSTPREIVERAHAAMRD
jgi:tripartite-type tricarboxylate transporter receptor subunit TctC